MPDALLRAPIAAPHSDLPRSLMVVIHHSGAGGPVIELHHLCEIAGVPWVVLSRMSGDVFRPAAQRLRALEQLPTGDRSAHRLESGWLVGRGELSPAWIGPDWGLLNDLARAG
ncbi:hypothetical protein [Tuwongella immobilis]|uniref:Uncharacterized protein n=1 Tax=Tuwongella immobilis TaxID=692036 RepID=A0A6C2YNH4_9BACT|nr:hypothetical protein [Tuwongella immobilis]VIP02986.1 unnamed protein product [Tuwongella immobilis]VTS03046.1 unnamed protein product [Tuwongella immobilis]